MVTCPHCGRALEADELVRHERPRITLVHCPACGWLLGRYRRHGQGTRRV